MTKLVQFFSIQKSLSLFSDDQIIQFLKNDFLKTDLGKIYSAVPWQELIQKLKLKNSSKGRRPIFSPKGEIALMILKSYTKLSDKQLADAINTNQAFQLFCGLPLSFNTILKDFKIISRIRVKLSKQIDWDEFQKILIKNWGPYIDNKGQILIDATCYETDMRYPTDAKLLWECLEYIYKKLKKLCKATSNKQPRSKYREIKKEYQSYSKRRKKSYKLTKKIIKKLLYLSKKLLSHLISYQEAYKVPAKLKQSIIEKVIEQQTKKLKGEKIEKAIVSLHKSYIRPIVRGKETKRVEFGAKVNKIQIDGINIVESLEFNNYNEGTRYESSVAKAEELTKVKVQVTGADGIYGTNKNRSYAKKQKIFTDFVRKGRAGKNEESRAAASRIIKKARSTKLEGSFGVEKRVYNLEKIKGRTEKTEILWIYLGIYTKNMLEIGRRIYASVKSSSFKEREAG